MEISIKQYFYHSIINDSNSTLSTIDSILKSKYIMTSNSLGTKVRKGCHSADEICLSKYTPIKNKNNYVSCFEIYLPMSTTFIIDKKFSKDFKVFKPKLVSTDTIFKSKRTSSLTNLYDEYRTKSNIPIDYIKGISIPYDKLISDPFIFYLYTHESALLSYYNGYIPSEMAELIYEEGSSSLRENERKSYMEEYIENINSIAKSNSFSMPIYLYNDMDSLVLKKK